MDVVIVYSTVLCEVRLKGLVERTSGNGHHRFSLATQKGAINSSIASTHLQPITELALLMLKYIVQLL